MVRLIVYRNYENFGEKKFVYDCTNREVIFFFFFKILLNLINVYAIFEKSIETLK